MGVVFLQHPGGLRYYCCSTCDAPLTNRDELFSTRFTGSTGRAFLFNKVVNVLHSDAMCRVMLTGRHMVRDVFCLNCGNKLGWMYEFATNEDQRYKEGKTILERALIHEKEGIDEEKARARARNHFLDTDDST